MNTAIVWKSGMEFDGVAGKHTVPMDAKIPIGKEIAATPKELVAMGLGGCTAMDVMALLKKHKQPPTSFRVEVDIQSTSGTHPIVFEKASLNYRVDGAVTAETLIEAVTLSQTKFCGVSAMLSKSFPIEYRIILNTVEIAAGAANFNA